MKSEKLKVIYTICRFSLLLCVFTGTFLLTSSPAFSQKQTPPPGGQPKPFVFPKQDNFTLPNGMQVTLVQYGAVPKVAMQAIVRAGHINEKADQNWVSDITALMLKEGTSSRTAEQIARQTAEMGGSIFTSASTDSTTVGGEVLSEFDTRFVNLLADVLLNPKFAPEDLEKIRANKIRELAINRAQAGNLAWEKFRQVVFSNHPYASIWADEPSLRGYKLDDVKAFYNSEYGAARTHLYVVGQFDSEKVKSAMNRHSENGRKAPSRSETFQRSTPGRR